MNELLIESLDQEGRGVARRDGKAVFVDGALPGERVQAEIYRHKASYELANMTQLLQASPYRTTPHCAYFGVCGGCRLQHVDARTQVAVKQRVLEDNLRHIGKVAPEQMLPPVHGPTWGYRHKARLTARHVVKKGCVLVGFHEKRSSYVADMMDCSVMPEHIARLLVPLRELLGSLTIRSRVPQVEVAVAENATVLVLRILDPLGPNDDTLLRAFAQQHDVRLYLQPKGPDTVRPLDDLSYDDLYYTLPEFDVRITFEATDFTQVNTAMNRILVSRAVSLLAPQPGERIADMFCGVGNFTLPIARSGAHVTGVEGSKPLIQRAGRNAEANGLAATTRFLAMDLFGIDGPALAAMGSFDRMLIDPPRDGACELIKALDGQWPARIVYVSCNPATLARDAGMLVNTHGYRLTQAGVMNMFPHTAHVESIAVFDRAA